MAQRIILASQSPRRKALLEQVGLSFDVLCADVDERILSGEGVDEYVRRVATTKAEKIAQDNTSALVIAADTVVAVDNYILTKPKDYQDAVRMWRLLSGRSHTVKTAVVFSYAKQYHHVTVTTIVDFKDLTEHEMHVYWQSGEPQDKAGAYAIQGRAAAWVKQIRGSYSNVVGLPLFETLECLAQIQQTR